MTEAERKEVARRFLDSAESWLRRLIESKLPNRFGPNYLGPDEAGGCKVISKDIRRQITTRFESDRGRFARVIDAADLGHVITIVLHPELHQRNFRDALKAAYPDGPAEARTFLNRLEEIRNKLAHGGTCSDRDHERAVCYSNDLIDSIKQHFREQNMERQFNVPTFTRVVDNRGNDFHLAHGPGQNMHFVDVRQQGNGDLYVGDELIVEAEVDPNFSGYSVDWMTFNGDVGQNSPVRLSINMKHVGLELIVRLNVRSSEPWHRLHGGIDDMVELRYRVLPPS
ncbi:hypothetical protein [Bradyrhizobium arachidis]|uniref:Swt1-like HEPN domain-containing protein n=1 Tax=Bradyrhizobium arachidis TaxID=858423 RepID=A0AAE7TIE1_9BRAD|nr:hypothetical protein [Bradyrhizobium arachidis]QOZ69204.1 hypothetical protein WN72_24925 [Bradyrhizobium arachidis]SFV11318.1 hypothetical protein SAMN05192541_11720 [Bradyrhizobium arachidis]